MPSQSRAGLAIHYLERRWIDDARCHFVDERFSDRTTQIRRDPVFLDLRDEVRELLLQEVAEV